ncbi:MAG: cation:dicarboxylase symporter family transporter [Eubacteriales bacterium]|nr:cation:dicarboxylase symporter family transporter [Eubacteriales bacterium]
MLSQRKEQYPLSAETIDRLALQCTEALKEAEVDQKDIIRLRLSLEDVLEIWLARLGEDAVVSFQTGTRLGKQFVQVGVKGPQVGIDSADDEEEFFLYNRLMAQAGLAFLFSYKNGVNYLTVHPPKKVRMGDMARLILAIGLAVVMGTGSMFLPDSTRAGIQAVVDPLFGTIMNCLKIISSPMIFLSICWGIINIGDVSVIGKIGKTILVRMTGMTFLISAVFALAISWMFPVAAAGGDSAGNGFQEIFQMILNIIPSDMVSPFLNGNALQIIFLGICIGVPVLILGDRVTAVRLLIEQVNEVVQFLMQCIVKMIPAFIFLSIYSLMLSGIFSQLGSVVKAVAIIVAGNFLILVLYLLTVAIRGKVRIGLLIRKMLPTHLIALTTASSSAAFATNLETCSRQLGIPEKVANFAVPLGQVYYMPSNVVVFLAIAMVMAENSGVSMTPLWIFTAVVVSGLLAIASCPIPGGALTCYTILFMQMGIPAETLPLAISIDMMIDFMATGVNLSCLQSELTLTCMRMKMVDMQILRK